MRSIIIGAGTYGEVYLSYLQESGIDVVGFLDDNKSLWDTKVRDIPVLGGLDVLPQVKELYGVEAVYCPIGNNKLRVQFLERAKELGYKTPNFIHKSVVISPNVVIGEDGIYILPKVIIMPWCQIDNYVMMSVGAIVSHHSHLEKGCFLSFGVNFGASIIAHKYAYCGISSTIMTGLKELGENCLIGAGAVVIKDVPTNAVVAGVPAKILKYKE